MTDKDLHIKTNMRLLKDWNRKGNSAWAVTGHNGICYVHNFNNMYQMRYRWSTELHRFVFKGYHPLSGLDEGEWK